MYIVLFVAVFIIPVCMGKQGPLALYITIWGIFARILRIGRKWTMSTLKNPILVIYSGYTTQNKAHFVYSNWWRKFLVWLGSTRTLPILACFPLYFSCALPLLSHSTMQNTHALFAHTHTHIQPPHATLCIKLCFIYHGQILKFSLYYCIWFGKVTCGQSYTCVGFSMRAVNLR